MSTQTIVLLAVVAVFALVILWRVRPSFGGGRGQGYKDALRKAQSSVEAAKNDDDKAAALCDAADACAIAFGRTSAAVSYYLRAGRIAPRSDVVLERALKGLSRHPHALETFVWRRMSHTEFATEPRSIQKNCLVALADAYARKGQKLQADSLKHVAAALDPRTPA
ncbi:hypothetical protein BH09MYX1_BH09MYX1_32330 [soil metagenome]